MSRLRSFAPLLLAATALAFPAAAYADFEEDLANTKCSADQLTSALQQVNPVAWNFISSDPTRLSGAQAQLHSFLALAPAARKTALHRANPDGSPNLMSMLSQYGDTGRQILDTCDQY